jgi:hypothetical protein
VTPVVDVAEPKTPSNAPPPDDGWGDAPSGTARREDPMLRITAEMRAELRMGVRTAVEEALQPVTRALQDLTATLERDRRERIEREARTAMDLPKVVVSGASPPPPPAQPAPATSSASPFAQSVSSSQSTWTAEPKPPSLVPTIPPAPISLGDLPVDFDGSRRKKRLGWIVALFLLLAVGSVGLLTILSRAS